MNILILTIGTRGDVQPYVALGKGLRAAGHDVTICTCASFESFVTEHGLNYAYVNDDVIEFMHSDDGKIVMENTGNLWEAIRTAIRLLPKFGPLIRRQIHDTWESTAATNPDLILYHPKAGGAEDFAERLDVPCMLAFYLPVYVPTGDAPAMLIPNLRLGRWYNRLTYRFIAWAAWLGNGKYVNEWREAHDLPRRRGDRRLRHANNEPIPALHGFSESVIPRPSDWPDTATVTGYWFLDRLEEWQPPAEVEDFLGVGEPPIYFGFGSIFGRDPLRLTRIVLDAVKATGVRAIIASGWGGLETTGLELPETVLAIDSAPHDWLFPKVAVVVHHGGCGTTAAGLRAGRPTIVCPFFGDQPFWGARIEALGVGPGPIPQKKLSVEKLSAAINQVRSDASIQERAEVIGRQIRSEDGVANACEFIDEWSDGL